MGIVDGPATMVKKFISRPNGNLPRYQVTGNSIQVVVDFSAEYLSRSASKLSRYFPQNRKKFIRQKP
jgi:hypothetical protein